jgi:hypothetical protein
MIKRLVGCGVGCCLWWLLLAANVLAQDTLWLDRTWRYQPKDLPGYGGARQDTRSWLAVDVDKPLPAHLRPAATTVGWYRTQFFLPDNWRKQAALTGGLVLHLGTPDGAAELWLNGKPLTTWGTLPPNLRPTPGPCTILLPAAALLWGLDNTLALRVGLPANSRGLWQGRHYLHTAQLQDILPCTLATAPPALTFAEPDTVPVTLSTQGLPTEQKLRISAYLVDLHTGATRWQQHTTATLPAGEEWAHSWLVPLPEPGDYVLRTEVAAGKLPGTRADSLLLRVAGGVPPALPEAPAGYLQFWKMAVAPLQDPKPAEQVLDSLRSGLLSQTYRMTLPNPFGPPLAGWLSIPRKSGTYPALLALYPTPPPGPQSTSQDIQLHIGLSALEDGLWPAAGTSATQAPLTRYYLQAAWVLAWLKQQPGVSLVTVQGQGLGATAALAAAALQPKLSHRCILIDPWLSQLHRKQTVPGLPAPSQHLEETAVAQWDALHIAPMVACPTLLVVPHSAATWPWQGTVLLQKALPQVTWLGYLPDSSGQPSMPAATQEAIRRWQQK